MTQTIQAGAVARDRESAASLAVSPVLRSRAMTLAASVAAHVAALTLISSSWHGERRAPEASVPPIPVVLFRPSLPALASPAPRAPEVVPRPQPQKRPRQRALVPPKAEPSPPPEVAVERVEPMEIAEDSDDVESGSTEQPAPRAGGGATGSAADGPLVGLAAPPPPPLSPEQRRAYLERYLQEIFRSRIAARFHYPEQAERLGIEGLVVLRVTILPSGALLLAKVAGECPHRILCEAAERTVRQAAPFPPPPAELGGAIAVAVPLQYRLE